MTEPSTAPAKGRRKEFVGRVVSNKMQKTVVVAVDRTMHHPLYRRTIRVSKRYYAHDDADSLQIGDVVRIVETRPLSKLKRWRVAEVVRHSQGQTVAIAEPAEAASPVAAAVEAATDAASTVASAAGAAAGAAAGVVAGAVGAVASTAAEVVGRGGADRSEDDDRADGEDQAEADETAEAEGDDQAGRDEPAEAEARAADEERTETEAVAETEDRADDGEKAEAGERTADADEGAATDEEKKPKGEGRR
ncbi:MAG TPA: 30S ribosomal protein S17 [Chloroflexota bacterium]|jgi:small subunit ribosomal protein S17